MKRILFIFAVLLWNLLPTNVFATGQIPEVIYIDGQKCSMFSCPLYSENEKLDSLFLDKYQDADYTGCTALWRDYIGFWSIKDNKLYLDSINLGIEDFMITDLEKEEVFKKYLVNGKVLASWVKDELRIVSGQCINYVHMGFGSIYEHESFYKIKNGKVKSCKKKENKCIAKCNVNNRDSIYALSKYMREKFPEIPGRILFNAWHTEFDKNGHPTKAEIEFRITYEQDCIARSIDEKTMEALTQTLTEYASTHIMADIYKVDKTIVSQKMTYPIFFENKDDSKTLKTSE